jgi:hypothetical protein
VHDQHGRRHVGYKHAHDNLTTFQILDQLAAAACRKVCKSRSQLRPPLARTRSSTHSCRIRRCVEHDSVTRIVESISVSVLSSKTTCYRVCHSVRSASGPTSRPSISAHFFHAVSKSCK